jgi:7-carboxy-7-deazaguanine synthase
MHLQVCETFTSILGEGTLAGLPAFFIRLTGCNLRCRYCDTAYAYEGGEARSVASLVEEARRAAVRLVLVTGGEPLLQERTLALMEELLQAGLEVLLETNGSLPVQGVDSRVRRHCGPEVPRQRHERAQLLGQSGGPDPPGRGQIRVSDQDDFAWALEVVRRHGLTDRLPVLISPAFGVASPAEVAAWIIASGLPLRLNLQLHKYIWGPEVRGV